MDFGWIMPVALLIAVLIIVYMAWKLFYSTKKIKQPVTKNQWERLYNDQRISARNNKMPRGKWIETEGDAYHPAIKKYARYYGSNDDPAVIDLWWKVKWWTPPRWSPVPKGLIRNISGRTIKVICNGFEKDGFLFRPNINSIHCESGKDESYYLNIMDKHIKNLFRIQEMDDGIEQVAYEKQYAMTHKSRPMSDITGGRPEVPMIEEVEPMTDGEG